MKSQPTGVSQQQAIQDFFENDRSAFSWDSDAPENGMWSAPAARAPFPADTLSPIATPSGDRVSLSDRCQTRWCR